MDKKSVVQMIQEDLAQYRFEANEIVKSFKIMEQETKDYIFGLVTQLTSSSSVPLLAKTPKISRKKGTRIKVIPEDDQMETDVYIAPKKSVSSQIDSTVAEVPEMNTGRIKRGASVKAADNIKRQQSMNLMTKLRQPSMEEINLSKIKIAKESQSGTKRPRGSHLEEEDLRPTKQNKVEKKINGIKNNTANESEVIIHNSTRLSDEVQSVDSGRQTRLSIKRKLELENEDMDDTLPSEQSMNKKSNVTSEEPVTKKANYSNSSPPKVDKYLKFTSTLDRISEKSGSNRSTSIINAPNVKNYKKNNIINETVDADETIASMYEDAIGKPLPIMNSTMNPNSTVTLEKMMNATVLIEPLPAKLICNETVTITASTSKRPSLRSNSTVKKISDEINSTNKLSTSKENVTYKLQTTDNFKTEKKISSNKFEELITDDESSPERKNESRKAIIIKEQKRVTRSTRSLVSDEDDEVLRTPHGKIQGYKISIAKSGYKQGTLFSPYAKDSVKKRVEAFEQVAISPKQKEIDTNGRVTRTKTRAMAAVSSPAPTVTQKLARKSLAKAKKISLAKQTRECDDTKENDNTVNKDINKKSSLEQSTLKSQLKTTPLGKSRMPIPTSMSKNVYTTPSNTQFLNSYSKPLTASRANVVTHVDSFIQPMKSASKTIDRTAEERRRKAFEEDARRKREELLKAQAEEKRRKREEKELRNKLAREAKEKLNYEKRLKAEKEKEEKAKLAHQLHEKQKEEMERRRLAQIQRAQEKEERRKQEELLRLQRLQEQEEQERLLAQQKRREQEMEKRKLLESKQLAEMKLKNQMTKAKAYAQKQYDYKIDSDPDNQESEDETKPKQAIPIWALKHVRQAQLEMQQYIPINVVHKFFDAKKCTPDLTDLFHGIDPRKLKRSSSAIWKTPPRYSMMNCSRLQD